MASRKKYLCQNDEKKSDYGYCVEDEKGSYTDTTSCAIDSKNICNISKQAEYDHINAAVTSLRSWLDDDDKIIERDSWAWLDDDDKIIERDSWATLSKYHLQLQSRLRKVLDNPTETNTFFSAGGLNKTQIVGLLESVFHFMHTASLTLTRVQLIDRLKMYQSDLFRIFTNIAKVTVINDAGGYYDEEGSWIYGFYDRGKTWFAGYYDEDGNWIGTGDYDEDERWIANEIGSGWEDMVVMTDTDIHGRMPNEDTDIHGRMLNEDIGPMTVKENDKAAEDLNLNNAQPANYLHPMKPNRAA